MRIMGMQFHERMRGGALNGLDDEQDDGRKEGRRLFSDISAVQVVATALASITSMLLASCIGIAGSVIGVGVASVVSTMAASLYKKFLADSAEKIKELPDAVKSVAHHGHSAPSEDAKPETADAEAKTDASEKTADHAESTAKAGASSEHPAARHKKRLIIICVASALIAVAVTATIVYAATLGQGLGAKPEPIIKTEIEQVERAAEPADDGSSSTPSEDSAQNTQNTNAVNQTNATNEQNMQNVQPENTEAANTQDQQPDQTDRTDQTNTQPAGTSGQSPDQENMQSAAAGTGTTAP